MSTTTATRKAPENLFGAPGDEWMDGDIHTAAERVLDAHYPSTPDEVVIEEWSAIGGADLVPASAIIIDRLMEDIADDWPHEGIVDHLPYGHPDVVAATEALRAAIGKHLHWSMAHQRVASYVFRLLPTEPGQVAWRCEELDLTISFPTS